MNARGGMTPSGSLGSLTFTPVHSHANSHKKPPFPKNYILSHILASWEKVQKTTLLQ